MCRTVHPPDHVGMEESLLFRELVEKLPLVTYVDEPGLHGRTLYVSPYLVEMLEYPAASWYADPDFLFDVVHPDDREWVWEARRGSAEEHDTSLVYRVVGSDGRVHKVQSDRIVVRDEAGTPQRTIGFWVDITERARLEERLRQAQKIEAIGRLAGGIAHDFNNLLVALRGYGELALEEVGNGELDTAAADLREVLDVVAHGEDLTRRILAFARGRVSEPELLDVNKVVSGAESLLRRLIGESITMTSTLAPAPVLVRADGCQLEQVLVNLVVNARDAMPDGGLLRIVVAFEEPRFAMLEVSDTGCGMDDTTLAQIFEPLFTTKQSNGTGFGLATVHEIVTGSGGRIDVTSTPGCGTAFTVRLPLARAA
jgi:two-component system, cell cycle sensor histidine kinase and response regulator CckA